jgi:hypothetical protein
MTKFLQFFDAWKSAGVISSASGERINVSANGTSTASPGALDKVIRESFKEMRVTGPQSNGHGKRTPG